MQQKYGVSSKGVQKEFTTPAVLVLNYKALPNSETNLQLEVGDGRKIIFGKIYG